MTEEEIKDLSKYFRLSMYRDEGDILLEEFEELNDIIKRSPYARFQEEARFKWLKGTLTDEEYKNINSMYDDEIYNIANKKAFKKH